MGITIKKIINILKHESENGIIQEECFEGIANLIIEMGKE